MVPRLLTIVQTLDMNQRRSGVLLHISSLPSIYGIGDLGPSAYAFVDFLRQAKQKCWQILPLNPTNLLSNNSPYSSPSAFAGNPLFISPELMREEGLLQEKDLNGAPHFPEKSVDYKQVTQYKSQLFLKAFKNFGGQDPAYKDFHKENAFWLDDYALFMALKNKFGLMHWNKWPAPYKDRSAQALIQFEREHAQQVGLVKFIQYLFFKQWRNLKTYCVKNFVEVIGDVPIYVHIDSVDVWMDPENYKLDAKGQPQFVAGAPPDAFSETGQRWGNPVYDWPRMKEKNFSWWINRIRYNLMLFDWIRIDHFRGLINYWEIPSRSQYAIKGQWVDVPTEDFFAALRKECPSLSIIAEDLGDISDEVRAKIDQIGFPGMKILLFAFVESREDHPYLPHNYPVNCVAYSGTHDNNTIHGWVQDEAKPYEKENLLRYLHLDKVSEDLYWHLLARVMESKAQLAIFPIQDVLGLGAEARMNIPATKKGNWIWRVSAESLNGRIAERLASLTEPSGRG